MRVGTTEEREEELKSSSWTWEMHVVKWSH